MKKFTAYLIAFAIALTAGAFYHVSNAQVTTDDGGSTAGSETSSDSTPSTDNGDSNRSSSGSRSSSSSRSNGGSTAVTFSDINLSREATNSLRVSWTTSIPTYGRVVFGEDSIVYPTIDPSQYYGYESGSAFGDDKTNTHTAVMFLAPGSTYYIRLIASTGDALVYGPEISATPTRSAEAPRSIDISPEGNSDEPAVIDLSKLSSTTPIAVVDDNEESTSTPNALVAAVGDAGRGIGQFFRDLWGMLFGRICK